MSNKYFNPCIRCGKERIDAETWEETVVNFIGTTIITHTKTVCPDPKCQKIVEKELENQKRKKEGYEKSRQDRQAKSKKLGKKR